VQILSTIGSSPSIFFHDFFADALFVSYSVFLHGKFGQTIGKIFFKIKVVVNENESEVIGYYRSIKRDSILIIFTAISYLPYFNAFIFFDYVSVFWFLSEIITTLFNEKRRAMHDFLAGSVVIDVRTYSKWEQSYYAEQKLKQTDSTNIKQ
jgi:uncharacterized RDD family membrane protein YckC